MLRFQGGDQGRGQARPLPYTQNRIGPYRVGAGLVPALATYSPYGIQMFLTWVDSRKNSWPSPCTVSNQSRLWPQLTHVRFISPAEASSTRWQPSSGPKYHIESTSS